MLASLDRHLKEAGSSISISKDRGFVNSRKVFEGKAHSLHEQGYGKPPRASKAQTTEDEELLCFKELLGNKQHFALQGCQERHDMFVDGFSFSKDDSVV